MYLKPGVLYDKEGIKRCELVKIRENMYQIIKISNGRNIWSCGLTEHETKRFKRMNKLFYTDELERMMKNDEKTWIPF